MSATAHLDSALPRTGTAVARPRAAWSRAAARVAALACVAIAAVLGAGVLGLGLYAAAHGDRIYEGVEIAGVPVGGMTQAEASAAIVARFDAYAAAPLALTAADRRFELTPRDLGARIDGDASARDAFAYGRAGSAWARSQAWARGLLRGEDVPPRVALDAATLDERLRAIAPAFVRAPVDAAVRMDAVGAPELLTDHAGLSLDLTASRQALLRRVSELGGAPVPLITRERPAAITVADLEPALSGARAAVDAPLVLTAAEGNWHVAAADLKQIVVADSTGVRVDRAPLETVVAGIAAEIDRPATDAGITVDEAGALVVAPGTDAATVDIAATTDRAVSALESGADAIDLTVARAAPAITDDLAAAAAERAESLIRDGLALTWDGGEGRLSRDDMLWALTIVPQPGQSEPFALGVDEAVVAELLGVVAAEIERPAADARFRIVDGRITVVAEAKTGRALDLDAGLRDIAAAFGKPAPTVRLKVSDVKPKFTAADLPKIKLNEEILGESTTYYGQSSDPRRQNVERAAQLEGGWLVAPGGVFSYVENVGQIDESTGFATGFGIVADEGGGITTAPVIGGGICQVSTTIFQAAFWAGMPIVERVQHPYWLTSYGQPPSGMTGLDAMVNVEDDWSLDMKFQNTTDGWIAVLVQGDGVNLTAKIVGTNPGWDIEVSDPEITNLVPKVEKMVYTDSPELPQGQELQVETAQDGFDVAISRVVTKDGEVIDDLTLSSSFLPARNMTLRGTGSTDGA